LKTAHPTIEEEIKTIDVKVYGHAMVRPLPGYIKGDVRKKLSQGIQGKIHFAHSDLSGISIFEEAFYQGHHAAQQTIAKLRSV
jgi:hypothetical protein